MCWALTEAYADELANSWERVPCTVAGQAFSSKQSFSMCAQHRNAKQNEDKYLHKHSVYLDGRVTTKLPIEKEEKIAVILLYHVSCACSVYGFTTGDCQLHALQNKTQFNLLRTIHADCFACIDSRLRCEFCNSIEFAACIMGIYDNNVGTSACSCRDFIEGTICHWNDCISCKVEKRRTQFKSSGLHTAIALRSISTWMC